MNEEIKSKVQALKEIILKRNPKSIFYLCHVNADPDAFAAAYVLGHTLDWLTNKQHNFFILADGYKQVTSRIIDYLDIDYVLESIPESPDLIVIVDTNNYEQLGNLKNVITKDIPVIIIDHHQLSLIKLNPPPILKIVDTEATSASELVYYISSMLEYTLSPIEATILLTGILSDTARFIHINKHIFGVVQELINKNADYTLALELLRKKRDLSERIALIKAAQRSELHRVGDWIILVSNVSSYEASASNMLLSLGADVSLVLAQKKNEFRISIRTTSFFYEETKINLILDLLNPLLEVNNQITGGGHLTAVGINGIGDGSAVLTQLLKLLKYLLNERTGNIKHS